MSEQRRLAAIMFTDIVGYTQLMGDDEEQALSLLRRNRSIHKSVAKQFKGKWLKEMGDGTLLSFNTISDAVYCAGALVKACQQEDIALKIGIHFGEITEEQGDIFGDGVNIASRIEPLAGPGEIMASGPIYRNVKNKPGITSTFEQETELKNVDEPIRVYQLIVDVDNLTSYKPGKSKKSLLKKPWIIATGIALLVLLVYSLSGYFEVSKSVPKTRQPEKSVAVLPFKNMSGDTDLDPFCEGMTDAVITRLSKISSLSKVSSRTSVFKYKESSKGLPEIATELGVNYILESSFQKDGDQIKINLQLIDASRDDHIWSDEYFDVYKDKFKIQAEVAESVASKLHANISGEEIRTIRKSPTDSDEAYNAFLRAEFQRHKSTQQAFRIAMPLYEKAIEIDSNFVEAYIGLANIWRWGGLVWGIYDEKTARNISTELLKIALEIDSTHEEAKYHLYSNYFYYDWNFKLVEPFFLAMRVDLIPVSIDGLTNVDFLVKMGRHNKALERINKIIVIDPLTPHNYIFKAQSLMFLNKRTEALSIINKYDAHYSDDYWYLRESIKLHYVLEDYAGFNTQLKKLENQFPTERPPIVLWFKAMSYDIEGNIDNELGVLKEMVKQFDIGKSGSPAWFISLYYFVKGDKENGFLWLQRSYDRHEVEMTWLREEPLLKPYRSDFRYKELYQKMNFPDGAGATNR